MEIYSNLQNSFKSILCESGFLPLDRNNPNWESMQIVHYRMKPDKNNISEFQKSIKNQLQFGGVYAYLDMHNNLLYFGEGKNIYTRIYSHYKEAYIRQEGNFIGEWDEFFSRNAGDLILLWRKLEDYHQRIAIEGMIENVIGSEFEKIYRPKNNNVGAT